MGTAAALAGYQSVPSPPSGTGILQTAASALPGAGAVSLSQYRAHGAGWTAGEAAERVLSRRAHGAFP